MGKITMSQDYAINDLRRLSRHRSLSTVSNHKCNCNKYNNTLLKMSKKVAKKHDTNHMIEVKNDDAPQLIRTYPNIEATFTLRNASLRKKKAIFSVKTHKRSSDLNFLHFKSNNISPIASYLSLIIRILVCLAPWLSSSLNTIIWRLHRCTTKTILNFLCVRYFIFCLIVTTSLGDQISHGSQLQNNRNNLHAFQNTFNSTFVSQPALKSSPEEITTPTSDRVKNDSTLPSANARISNLLNRDAILIHQHQHKGISLHNENRQQKAPSAVNNSPESPPSSTCSTCHARAKAKIDSLETIKVHILSQLRLPPPGEERSKRRDVPKNILDTYYSEYDHNGQRRDYKKKLHHKPQTHFQKNPELYGTIQNYDQVESIKIEQLGYDDGMQNDDPRSFPFEDYEDEEEDQLYTHINSIYVFPVANKLRHNRRSEFLTFKFEGNDQTIITGAVLHLYIRGQEWMKEFQPEVMKQIPSDLTEPVLSLNVHRALRRSNSLNYTHTIQMTQIRHHIPSGLGKWIQIELKDLPKIWMDKDQNNNLIIVVKTKDDWMRHFIETGRSDIRGTESALTAHIEVRTQLSPGRQKRSASLDCQESDNELRCCRYPLKVNFTSFGWSFVVAPTDFDAYFCNGECKLGFLPEHPHTHLAALTRSASPCCSPTKMSSLTLLYFNLEQNLVLSTIPNMTVEKCSCS